MFTIIRHSTRQLRAWLIAAAAILALTSVLEAGHVHGTFTQADDHCTLCQHSVGLDKFLLTSTQIVIVVSATAFTFIILHRFFPQQPDSFALIRAPPV